MKCINDYDKIIFLGGGVMADRIYEQIENIEDKLIGVMDLQEDEKRLKKEFKGFKIASPEYFKEELEKDSVAIIVAIGNVCVPDIVEEYIRKYNNEEKLFVVNPYTSLRFFYVDDKLAREGRIPITDSRYDTVKNMFEDELSLKIFKSLLESKPYDSIDDSYEIVPFLQIKEMYYFSEDYWQSYNFKAEEYNSVATILDCGAYNGDSIFPICQKIPQSDIFYYAFEPLKENAESIRNNSEFEKVCSRLEILEYGVGDEDARLTFELPENGDKEGGRFVEKSECKSDESLEIRRLDGLNLDVRGTLYIKMDIEGSELKALKGAANLMKTHHPYLAICLYHRKNDLVEIPLYLYNLLPDYKFYLRGGYHTILWAIPSI